MSRLLHSLLLLLSGLLAISCANGSAADSADGQENYASETNAALESECEEALSSFSISTPFEQTTNQRRRLLQLVQREQLDRYGSVCETIPNWRTRFDDAYRLAYREAASLSFDRDAVIDWQPSSDYIAAPECTGLIDNYAAVLEKRADSVSASQLQTEIESASRELSDTDCLRDRSIWFQYNELRSKAVAMGIILGPSNK